MGLGCVALNRAEDDGRTDGRTFFAAAAAITDRSALMRSRFVTRWFVVSRCSTFLPIACVSRRATRARRECETGRDETGSHAEEGTEVTEPRQPDRSPLGSAMSSSLCTHAPALLYALPQTGLPDATTLASSCRYLRTSHAS